MEVKGLIVIIFSCLHLSGLVCLFQVQFRQEYFVVCQQLNDASQAYVVYLVGRRPSGSMASLPAELPRDVSFAITSVTRQGASRTDVSFLDSQIHSISDHIRIDSPKLCFVFEVIQLSACCCLQPSIENKDKPRNSRMKFMGALK